MKLKKNSNKIYINQIFTTFKKYFLPKIKGKYFHRNQAKFFLNWKIFSVD
jgi:hypothetical protein